MTVITTEELAKFRNALQTYGEEASETLNIVDECNGDLENAMEILLVKSGKEPMMGADDWIDFENIAKSLREFICDPEFKDFILNDAFAMALGYLLAKTTHPAAFLILILLYVVRKGIQAFCGEENLT